MTLTRGTLVSFDAGSYLASVRLIGSSAQALAGLRTSRAIPAVEMVAGRTVLVYLPADGGRESAMLIAITG